MKNFVLRCVKKSHPDIDLPDFLPVIIGRNRQTEITNSRLSRHHVKLTANVSKKQVLCQIIGPNGSKLNGEKVLHKNEKVVLKSGDKIELLEGLYEHLIVLEQAQEENSPKNSMVQVHLSVIFFPQQFFFFFFAKFLGNKHDIFFVIHKCFKTFLNNFFCKI